MAPLFVPAQRVGVVMEDWLTRKVLAMSKHLTILPIPSSGVLASICLSTGLISAAVDGPATVDSVDFIAGGVFGLAPTIGR